MLPRRKDVGTVDESERALRLEGVDGTGDKNVPDVVAVVVVCGKDVLDVAALVVVVVALGGVLTAV